jgi:hypothetical protein
MKLAVDSGCDSVSGKVRGSLATASILSLGTPSPFVPGGPECEGDHSTLLYSTVLYSTLLYVLPSTVPQSVASIQPDDIFHCV